jgi:hypothetical protein
MQAGIPQHLREGFGQIKRQFNNSNSFGAPVEKTGRYPHGIQDMVLHCNCIQNRRHLFLNADETRVQLFRKALSFFRLVYRLII